MKKNTMLGMFVLALVGLFIGTVFVSAYRGDPTQVGPNYSEERHEMMESAFDNNDYESWYALMTQDGRSPGVLRWVNEDNFGTFVAMREARISGDVDTVDALRDELGMGQGRGIHSTQRGSQGYGRGQGSRRGFSGGCSYMN